jgi:glycyl-tRNA synthetase beta subunit
MDEQDDQYPLEMIQDVLRLQKDWCTQMAQDVNTVHEVVHEQAKTHRAARKAVLANLRQLRRNREVLSRVTAEEVMDHELAKAMPAALDALDRQIREEEREFARIIQLLQPLESLLRRPLKRLRRATSPVE